jgi:ankyrin repeat protein
VKQDQLQALQLLLQHGTPGPQLERALQVAVKHRKPAAVSLLLQHRGRCANSDFLLHVASKRGSVEVVQMLMQNGVIDANSSAVVKALMGGNTDIKQVLAETVVTSGAASLERQVIRAVDLGAAGALDKLLCAAKQRSLQVPQHLLHSLVRTAITTFNKYGCCARGVRCVKVLISHGADLNAQHGAPLLAAVLRNNMPALRYLVSRGADVNAGGGAALRAAIDLQKLKSVTELVKAGADVDPTDLHLMLRLPLPSPYDSRAHEARSLTEALRARNLID